MHADYLKKVLYLPYIVQLHHWAITTHLTLFYTNLTLTLMVLKNYLPLAALLWVCLLVSAPLSAQELSELQTPIAEAHISSGGGANDEGTIYYGAVPANSSNRPVLVFVHGYTGSASTWWNDNQMYTLALNAGYRTAFVSLGPDKTMWHNGQLLANMLNTITTHYGVSRVVLVGHSKGGLDIEAALVHYGAWNRVSRVVTLGSPFFGSPLADIAQSGWTWFLSYIFGQRNDATYVLQTSYMNYVRSITDNHPNNSRVDLRSAGAWGYNQGAWYLVPASWFLSGSNDGVVEYSSTRRPNSVVLFGDRDSRMRHDHFQVALGQRVWQHISNQFATAPINMVAEDFPRSTEAFNPNAVLRSQHQIISADKGVRQFYVAKAGAKIELQFFRPEGSANIQLKTPSGTVFNQTAFEKQATDDIFGGVAEQMNVSAAEQGYYEISSSEPFLAIITTQNDVLAELRSDLNDHKLVYQTGEAMHYTLQLSGGDAASLNEAQVSGTLLRVGDLEGNRQEGDSPVVLKFQRNGNGTYRALVNENLSSGIYTLHVSAKSPSFTRNLVGSVAVVGDNVLLENRLDDDAINTVMAYPNPATGEQVSFRVRTEGARQLNIYDLNGALVSSFKVSGQGTHTIFWNLSGIANGLYIYRLEGGERTISKKLIIKR
jgi:pimeloyl-ACP methyl ester carboxylesterase